MERLTKTELRTLLECIEECYPNCDLETFTHRLVSRLAKIVPADIISDNGVNPRRRAAHSHHAYPSSKSIFGQRARISSLDSSVKDAGRYTRPIPRKVLSLTRRNITSTAHRQVAINRGNKAFADRDQLLLGLSSQVIQPYRNPKTVAPPIQQKFTLVDHALDRLHLGLILLTPDGKICLATARAVQQVRVYLGNRFLTGDRLPESLWTWVKQQEAIMRKKADSPLPPSRLILVHEGKRLVIRLVPDLDQSSLLLEEHTIPTEPPSVMPRDLSPREIQVLDSLSQGKTNKEIGVILGLSPRTVQKHLEHIYRKLGVETRTAAAAKVHEIASVASKQTNMFLLVVSTAASAAALMF